MGGIGEMGDGLALHLSRQKLNDDVQLVRIGFTACRRLSN